jgi:hypothetical protein
MTEALHDSDQQAGPDPLEQADERPGAKVGTGERPTPWPVRGVGMPRAQAEVLGDYNLHNG